MSTYLVSYLKVRTPKYFYTLYLGGVLRTANFYVFLTDVPAVEDDWKSEEVAAVGQLLLDVSQQLARE